MRHAPWPHGPHCPRPRSIINLDQGFKGIGGPNATWEGLHPPRLHNLHHSHSRTVHSVYSLPRTPHLIALCVDMHAMTLTSTSSWSWSVEKCLLWKEKAMWSAKFLLPFTKEFIGGLQSWTLFEISIEAPMTSTIEGNNLVRPLLKLVLP